VTFLRPAHYFIKENDGHIT